MSSVDGRDSEDSTSESFNYEVQLLANKHNKFTQLSNPSAEPILLFMSKRKGKVIRKCSTRSVTLYNSHKKIIELIKKFEHNPSIEDQVITMVQRAIDLGGMSSKKLEAIVASALYLVYRLNHSQIFLSQITKVYNLRSADISKCLAGFKKLGLYQEVGILSLWPIYTQLVDQWFPYTSSHEHVPRIKDKKEKKLECEFAINPASSNSELLEKREKEEADNLTIREKLMNIGRVLTEMPEIDLAKQGKLPQTFAAGIFMVATKFCSVQIHQREVAKKLSICTSTVAQSKRGIIEILIKKAGAVDAVNKWDRIVDLIKSIETVRKT